MCLQKNYLLLIWNLIWTQPPVFCLATLPGWLLKEEGWERPLWEGDIDDTPEISTSPKAETSVCVCVCVCVRAQAQIILLKDCDSQKRPRELFPT